MTQNYETRRECQSLLLIPIEEFETWCRCFFRRAQIEFCTVLSSFFCFRYRVMEGKQGRDQFHFFPWALYNLPTALVTRVES